MLPGAGLLSDNGAGKMGLSLPQAAETIGLAYSYLLPGRFNNPLATALMLAIGLQESEFLHPIQLVGNPPRPVGPAHGYWQFEEGGGVVGVMTHDASERYARAVCLIRGVPFDRDAIHRVLALDHVFAAAFARLLLWTDRAALPPLGDFDAAFAYYLRNWRPGAFKRDPRGVEARFRRKYAEAIAFMRSVA
jgi:hypothetical protein